MENHKEFMRKKSEEPPKRCPRCDSMHTKFCYFNNYSPSQPRHFCKSCRRYWTDGGTIRNIPQGGGCIRKAKRTRKSSSSALLDQRNHLSAPAQEINGAGFHHSSRVPISYCFVEQSPDPARVLPPSLNVGAFAAGFGEPSFKPVDLDMFAWQQQQKMPALRQANTAQANASKPAANWGGAAARGGGVEAEEELDRWVRELANDGSV